MATTDLSARWRSMKHILPTISLVALAACSDQPAENESADTAENAVRSDSTPVAAPVGPTPTQTPTATPVPAVTPGTTSIPATFQGEWRRRLDQCGDEANESRLRIDAGRLVFFESVGTVIGVTGDARSITVRARYEGEGESWENNRTFSLSDDGRQLTAEGMVRVRCP